MCQKTASELLTEKEQANVEAAAEAAKQVLVLRVMRSVQEC
jgi:hypothetical protein